MDQAQVVAHDSLAATVDGCQRSGLVEAWRILVRDVYASGLDRYEPDELGDTPMSLGLQCSENLKTRAVRRFQHDDREQAEVHWVIDGLRVANPKNVLTFILGKARIVTMKVPFNEGRSPRWDQSCDWEQDSQVRLTAATENSRLLQYRTAAPGTSLLFHHPVSHGDVQNYMLLWGGEPDAALTAGWLAVPVLGETPFIARQLLWWDDDPRARITTDTVPDRGPSFDQRPSVRPELALKQRPQEGEA